MDEDIEDILEWRDLGESVCICYRCGDLIVTDLVLKTFKFYLMLASGWVDRFNQEGVLRKEFKSCRTAILAIDLRYEVILVRN